MGGGGESWCIKQLTVIVKQPKALLKKVKFNLDFTLAKSTQISLSLSLSTMLTKHLAQVLDTLNMKALLIWAVLLNFYKLLKTGDCASTQ